MKNLLPILACLLFVLPCRADDIEYRPGGEKWSSVWQTFYNNPGCEADLMTPLVEAGPRMTGTILEAISHKNMKLRRYAIGALGWIKDKKAIPALTAILKDQQEIDYFRGDALESIYLIDEHLGLELAKEYKDSSKYFRLICPAILRKDPDLKVYPKCGWKAER